jgi:hypothetical protein
MHAGTGRPLASDPCDKGKASTPEEILVEVSALANQKIRKGDCMKKLLLMGLAVSGLSFVTAQRADAQSSAAGGVSFGFPGGFYAYPTAYNYYPYGYYMRPYYNYSQSYSYRYGGTSSSWYNGRRTYRHTRRHHYQYRY